MRGRMYDRKSYVPPFQIGQPLDGASVGLVVNWFGDSLDGTVARVRKMQRPKFGYYLDHLVDDGRVVKGVHFVDIRDAGDPVELWRCGAYRARGRRGAARAPRRDPEGERDGDDRSAADIADSAGVHVDGVSIGGGVHGQGADRGI